MQKTSTPITFRDAAKFYKLAGKVQNFKYTNDFVSSYRKQVKMQANLEKFSEKLAGKAAPEIFRRLQECNFSGMPSGADKVQLNTSDYKYSVAPGISCFSDRDNPNLNYNLKFHINHLTEYKNNEEAKFSLKGQTFSSIMKHFALKSNAIFNHQGAIAGAIFDAISLNIYNLLVERSEP